MSEIKPEFFEQDAIDVAPKLLGVQIYRKTQSGYVKSGIIVETEAYMQDDPACHAFNGMTLRTRPMFEKGGISYIYLIYGMYYCLNIVTGNKGCGQAVLIRALEPLNGDNLSKIASGPGKLSRFLEINKNDNGILFSKKNNIWFEKGIEVDKKQICFSERVGISKGKEFNWRFYIKDNPFVSKTKQKN